MLKSKLLHPGVLSALAGNGHGARVLIADANFPFSTKTPASANIVYLNLARGLVTVTDVLEVLTSAVLFEQAVVMDGPEADTQELHQTFTELLGGELPLIKVKRSAFYDEVGTRDTCLVIATGEARRYANILLTIGVLVGGECA